MPNDIEAYDCLMRGISYHRMGGVTRENAATALSWFYRAIEKDPKLARAHA
ncbi:MAG: hypothetical protein JKY94_05735 [Rhodobacteraceae bacterium]|nr:hypothetical protein [Paracoccaceae bacterium]